VPLKPVAQQAGGDGRPGTPITVEDVLNSRMIAYPFRLLQYCLVTDGRGAVILVAAERTRLPAESQFNGVSATRRTLRKPPVVMTPMRHSGRPVSSKSTVAGTSRPCRIE
jgi:acetyl-CoA acetyltransferase